MAEEISDHQQAASKLRHDAPTLSTKAELRVVGEDAVRNHVSDPKGEWVIVCECGHQATVRIAFFGGVGQSAHMHDLPPSTMAHRGGSEAAMGIEKSNHYPSTTSPTEGN
ncbi:hypothetical protein ACFIOY_00255 [Bradyrhizobium sp. TZ2]